MSITIDTSVANSGDEKLIATAPASGIIGDIPVRVGDRVTPATRLTTLDQNQMLEAYVSVPIERAGGGLIIADAALTPEWIRDVLVPILLDPDLVAAMSQSAADMGARESDEWLAAEVFHAMGA